MLEHTPTSTQWSRRRRLTNAQAEAMRCDRADGATFAALAARYGVTASTARAIVYGERYKDAGGPIAERVWFALSDAEADAIREAIARGARPAALASRYGTTRGAISHLTHGRAHVKRGPEVGAALAQEIEAHLFGGARP